VLLGAAGTLGVSLATVAVAPWFALAALAYSTSDAAISVVGVAEDLLVQRRVADGVRGRVYAARIAAVQVSVAAPLLLAGALIDALGAQAVFGLAAAMVALGVTTLAMLVARAAISGQNACRREP
jgi:hypothetical protein